MKRFSVSHLERLTATLVEHAGVSPKDAQIFARALVDADVHGTSTHGLSRLSIYLERIQRGLIDPKGELKVVHQNGSVLALDAGNALGQVQAVKTLEMLTPLAKNNGLAAATVRNSQHFGALSYYCNLAANEGMILLAMTNCEPAMAPTGGYEPFFGTNPIAASFPNPTGTPVKIDMATSIVARGNIIAANKKKQPIPEGWALTSEGLPTTDAAEALRGTVQTMAGHKGYALALMVEVFSSVLSGAAIGSQIGSMYKNLDRKQDVGHFFCLFDVAAFLPREEYDERMGFLLGALKANKKQPGVDEILIPGERSQRTADAHRSNGVPVGEETIAELEKWCQQFGVPFDAGSFEV
jgi:LDH2 family malate/lactate/ureidoglycolate dehydrogenase